MLGLIVDGRSVDRAREGQVAEIILGATALYAESGGQDADAGTIVGPGYELEVLDVQKPVKGLISHKVLVRSGEVGVAAPATSVVDADYRRGARQAHSGTHIIHAALRQVLGLERAPVGFVQQGRLPAPRLLLEPGALRRDPQRDRGDLEQRDPAEPRGHHARAAAGRGEVAGRHGAVRREVRRRRAGRRHRRPLVARALRGNARHDELRDRDDQPGQRVVGRFDEPPRRVAGRPGGVQGPRGGADHRVAAVGLPQDAARAAAGEDRRPDGEPQGGREAHPGVRGPRGARQGSSARCSRRRVAAP